MNSKNNIKSYFTVLLALVFIIVITPSVSATHIIGGQMSYKCLGNDRYEVSFVVRRDCILGAEDAHFDIFATLTAFSPAGEVLSDMGENGSFRVERGVVESVTIQDENCTDLSCRELCVDQAFYSIVITLPYREDGYILAYQRCCRNETLANIAAPLETGGTWFLDITARQQSECNSSPEFGEWPNIALCTSELYSFSHTAEDPDGDSLVYKLFTPHTGGSLSDPKPDISSPPPFQEVEYANGFSLENLMASDIPLSINPVTGELSIAPSIQGQFLIGVEIEEWRDGSLLAKTRRNFEFNVCGDILPICEAPQDTFIITRGESIDLLSGTDTEEGCIYTFDPNDDIVFGDPATGTNPVASPDSTTLYNVTVTNGTTSDDGFVFVIVEDVLPDCPAPQDTLTICLGESIDLMTGFTPTIGCTYIWSPSEGLEFGNTEFGTNPVVSPMTTTTYSVTATNGTDDNEGTVVVIVNDLSASCDITLIGIDVDYCIGIDINEVSATSSCEDIDYSWSPGTAIISGGDTDNPTFNLDMTTDITLTITDPETGCSADTTFTINIAPDPTVDITASPGTTVEVGETVTLTATPTGTGPFTYLWDTGETTESIDFTADPPARTETFMVTVTDANGCEAVGSINIVIEQPPCAVGLPNAFTPNGDGVNDAFVIRTTRNFTSLDFQILDRWGGTVFESRNPSNTSWDGTLNGREISPDVFAYCAIITCEDGMEFKLVGNVTLLR